MIIKRAKKFFRNIWYIPYNRELSHFEIGFVTSFQLEKRNRYFDEYKAQFTAESAYA